MNKFVVRFEKNDNYVTAISGESFIFNNPLDAIDYFERGCSFKSVRQTDNMKGIVVTDHNFHPIFPTCFWAKMPNA